MRRAVNRRAQKVAHFRPVVKSSLYFGGLVKEDPTGICVWCGHPCTMPAQQLTWRSCDALLVEEVAISKRGHCPGIPEELLVDRCSSRGTYLKNYLSIDAAHEVHTWRTASSTSGTLPAGLGHFSHQVRRVQGCDRCVESEDYIVSVVPEVSDSVAVMGVFRVGIDVFQVVYIRTAFDWLKNIATIVVACRTTADTNGHAMRYTYIYLLSAPRLPFFGSRIPWVLRISDPILTSILRAVFRKVLCLFAPKTCKSERFVDRRLIHKYGHLEGLQPFHLRLGLVWQSVTTSTSPQKCTFYGL